MKAYSVDLRQRIVQAVEGGMSPAEAARIFRVGRSTVKRYLKLRERQGDLQPKAIPGRPPTIGPEQFDALRRQVGEWPDATLAEHVRLWSRRQNAVVSLSTMSRALRSVGWGRPRRR